MEPELAPAIAWVPAELSETVVHLDVLVASAIFTPWFDSIKRFPETFVTANALHVELQEIEFQFFFSIPDIALQVVPESVEI